MPSRVKTHKVPDRFRFRIKKGDKVIVIRGAEKGTQGTVMRVDPGVNRVVIEGVNVRKKHMRPSQANPEGGIISHEFPIHVSKVAHVDPETGKATRIRMEIDAEGAKKRVAVKSGKVI